MKAEQIRNSAVSIGIMILLPLTLHMGLNLLNITPIIDTYFYIITAVGIASLLIGIVTHNYAMGAGLIMGGILSLCYGYIAHWPYISNTFKFISFLIAFIILILGSFKFMQKPFSK